MSRSILSHKKAQVIGQVFVFILAILVFVLVITYGYSAITTFLEKQHLLTLIQFRNDLEQNVEIMKPKIGSVKEVTLNIPSKTNEICLVDFENPQDLEKNRPLLYSLWTSKKNIFLLPKPSLSLYLEDVKISNGYCCIQTKGKLILKFENVKNKVFLSPVSEKCEK